MSILKPIQKETVVGIVLLTSALSFVADRAINYYIEQPAQRDRFEVEAVNHNAGRFNPKTRVFEWIEVDPLADLPSLFPSKTAKR